MSPRRSRQTHQVGRNSLSVLLENVMTEPRREPFPDETMIDPDSPNRMDELKARQARRGREQAGDPEKNEPGDGARVPTG